MIYEVHIIVCKNWLHHCRHKLPRCLFSNKLNTKLIEKNKYILVLVKILIYFELLPAICLKDIEHLKNKNEDANINIHNTEHIIYGSN